MFQFGSVCAVTGRETRTKTHPTSSTLLSHTFPLQHSKVSEVLTVHTRYISLLVSGRVLVICTQCILASSDRAECIHLWVDASVIDHTQPLEWSSCRNGCSVMVTSWFVTAGSFTTEICPVHYRHWLASLPGPKRGGRKGVVSTVCTHA